MRYFTEGNLNLIRLTIQPFEGVREKELNISREPPAEPVNNAPMGRVTGPLNNGSGERRRRKGKGGERSIERELCLTRCLSLQSGVIGPIINSISRDLPLMDRGIYHVRFTPISLPTPP